MNGLAFLLDMVARGAEFNLDRNRGVRVVERAGALPRVEYTRLRAIKAELRTLLMTELPDDPGDGVCTAFDAAEGVGICRRCARGLGEHFWKRRAIESVDGFPGERDR